MGRWASQAGIEGRHRGLHGPSSLIALGIYLSELYVGCLEKSGVGLVGESPYLRGCGKARLGKLEKENGSTKSLTVGKVVR